MLIEKVKISQIKSNPNNPRTIKDENFKKLVQSIKDFPEMLEIRPIVVNDDMVVLGGNMRLKACKEAGLKEVPIINAKDLTEEQQREFIIKDNVSIGGWNFQVLENQFDSEKLTEWGANVNKNGYFQEQLSKNDIIFKPKYPITIVVDEDDFLKWNEIKEKHGEKNDLKLFLKLIK